MDDYETPFDGTFDYEDIDEKELEPDLKPKATFKAAAPATMPPTKGNYYSRTPEPPDESQNYECPVPTLPRVGKINIS